MIFPLPGCDHNKNFFISQPDLYRSQPILSKLQRDQGSDGSVSVNVIGEDSHMLIIGLLVQIIVLAQPA